MFRLQILIFVSIILSVHQIGAKNTNRFELGLAQLNNRTDYCHWLSERQQLRPAALEQNQAWVNGSEIEVPLKEEVADRIFSTSKLISVYRSKKIHYSNLPQFISNEVFRRKTDKLAQIHQYQTQVRLLEQQAEKIEHFPSADKQLRRVAQYKSKLESPKQIQLLKNHLHGLRAELHDLSILHFSPEAMEEILNSAVQSKDESEPISTLGLEIQLSKNLLSPRAQVRPVWITEGLKPVPASEENHFELSASMLPSDFIEALDNKKLPDSFFSYFSLSREALNSAPQIPEIEFTSSSSLIIKAKSNDKEFRHILPDHFSTDAILDLACLQKSRWTKELILKTENLIEDHRLQMDGRTNKVSENTQLALKILKRLQ